MQPHLGSILEPSRAIQDAVPGEGQRVQRLAQHHPGEDPVDGRRDGRVAREQPRQHVAEEGQAERQRKAQPEAQLQRAVGHLRMAIGVATLQLTNLWPPIPRHASILELKLCGCMTACMRVC